MKKAKYLLCVFAVFVIAFAFASCNIDETPDNQNVIFSYTCETGGSINGNARQSVKINDFGRMVEAVADNGYEFVGWSDGVQTAKRQDKAADKDLNVTAMFSALPISPIRHVCQSICPVCGGCLNGGCAEDVCSLKCNCQAVQPHICNHVCEKCGGCTDTGCQDEACSDKCACVVAPPHTCQSICAKCGKCQNAACKESVCLVKCDCKVSPVPEHKCGSVCSACGKCRNADCHEEVCLEKCTCSQVLPHTCESKCTVCGKCQNTNCREQACLSKCSCKEVHVCHSICPVCGGCLNDGCAEDACVLKCSCQTIPPHICNHICEKCGGCTDANCQDELCSDKCICIVTPPHTCQSKCTKCGKCRNADCRETACIAKCNCEISPAPEHECSDFCHTCGKCLDISCYEAACQEKCSCPLEERSFLVEYIANPTDRIEGETRQIVKYGERCTTVRAICSDEAQIFYGWSDGLKTAERCDERVVCNMTLRAIFRRKIVLLKYYTDGNGTIKTNSMQMRPYGGSGEPVVAIPNKDYEFVMWSDGLLTAYRHDIGVTDHIVVTAIFKHIDQEADVHKCESVCANCGKCRNKNCREILCEQKCYCDEDFVTIRYIVDNDEHGSIQGNLVQVIPRGSDGEEVTVIPNEDYAFRMWTDWVDTAQRRETNVTEDITIGVLFRNIIYSLEYSTDGNGVVQGDEEQYHYSGEDGWTVTAVANEGYEFVMWSDGVTTATRKEVSIKNSLKVYAIFKKIDE